MKVVSLFFTAMLISSVAYAGMPRFPADKIDKLEQLSESEQAEAGAFMLFYDLVSQGKIGGNSGLCLSYTPGDAGGAPDKISVGLDSKSYPTGIASIDQVPVEKLQNLKSLMKQIGRYLDSGCDPGKQADCKAGRNVSITGYADAQHYGATGKNEGKVEASIVKNISLAQNRAALFSQVINGEGFVNSNQVKSYGMASPIGEYLAEGLPVPAKYNPDGKTFTPANYRQNCPERRVTVIDIEFNAKKVETNTLKGVISPSVKSATKNFVKLSNFGASIQTLKAAKELKMSLIENDKDADKLIDKIMEMNGIKNPQMIAACKNLQTRTMVREHFQQHAKTPAAIRSKMESKSELELMRLAQLPRDNKDPEYVQNSDLVNYYKDIEEGFGGIKNKAQYPLLTTDGISTTLSDCFSAKNSMQAEFIQNPSLRKELCKPVNDYKGANEDSIDIKFHPHELEGGGVVHIGCKACNTGFRYVPKKYKNPETGKEETQMVPVYVDREANILDKANPALNSYRPIEGPEVADIVVVSKSISVLADEKEKATILEISQTKDGAKRKELIKYKAFLVALGHVADGKDTLHKPSIMSDMMSDPNNKELQGLLTRAGVSLENYKKTVRLNDVLHNPVYGSIERKYAEDKMKGRTNLETQKYEQVIIPGIKARDALTNWHGTNTSTEDSNNLLFGSMKKPRYFMVDDCDCNSTGLIEKALTKGKVVQLDPVPHDKLKEKVGKDACLVSIPVPPSCMYDPNEAVVTGKEEKPAESRIKWMGLNGENMDKAISEMKNHFIAENQKVKLSGCEGLPPLAVAQKIVDSAECSGENSLPHSEELDCKK